MKVGRVSLKEDMKRIEAALESAGENFQIAVDVNCGWTMKQSEEFCRNAKGYSIAWLEEPLKWYEGISGQAPGFGR